MVADWLLTIACAKGRAAVFAHNPPEHSYELNPLWRKSVDNQRWFNLRHLVVVIVVSAMLVFLDHVEEPPYVGLKALMGVSFGSLGPAVGRHLANLLLLREFGRHPDLLSNHRSVPPTLALRISQFSLIGWLPLLVILASLVPNPYTVGTFVGLLGQILVHSLWRRRADAGPAR